VNVPAAQGLDGRRVLITGAATGIGRETAQLLARRGARVIVNYKDEAQADDAEMAVEDILEAHGIAHAVCADIGNPRAVANLFVRSIELLGGLDMVVSNAAGDAVIRPIADTTEEEYDRVMALNARGPFVVMQEAARRLSDGGRIVIVSSSTAAIPYPGSASFAGAKRASEIYAMALAAELGERAITVNVVSPGPTDTPAMRVQNTPECQAAAVAATPLGRRGQADDIAEVIAFLASADSGWMTRQIIQVGGGIV
jgi:3-oxoacyl-[acyl-carrier protein] reductase